MGDEFWSSLWDGCYINIMNPLGISHSTSQVLLGEAQATDRDDD